MLRSIGKRLWSGWRGAGTSRRSKSTSSCPTGLSRRSRRRDNRNRSSPRYDWLMEAIFRVDGGKVEVGPNAAGPWDPRMQHGSAPAGLAVWAAQSVPTQVAMRVARVTVDLMRPVPLAPLTLETEVLREGRKIQLCAIRLRAGGTVVVAASVLKVKLQAESVPPDVGGPELTLPGPDVSPEDPAQFSNSPFVMGMQLRAARGTFGVQGPGAIWYRIRRPFVEGSAVSQAMRAVIAADFCNGTSAALDFRDWTFLN